MSTAACEPDLRISKALAADEIERRVRRALPIGAGVSEVEAYARCNGLEFSRAPKTRRIHAIVRNVRGSWLLYDTSVQMVFAFDYFDRLRAVEIQAVHTGL